jgi:hypothetical protein
MGGGGGMMGAGAGGGDGMGMGAVLCRANCYAMHPTTANTERAYDTCYSTSCADSCK